MQVQGASNQEPSISVALCTYNGAAYLREQVQSILDQTKPPLELIISDDGSSDDSLTILRECCAGARFPVQIIEAAHNIGIKGNFERAMAACSGDYIALSDQDDLWHPEKLERFSRIIADSDCSLPALYFSDPELIDERGESLGKSFLQAAHLSPPEVDLWRLLSVGNFVPGCTMVFSRNALAQILPIPGEAILHDWWIVLFFSLCGEVRRVEGLHMFYRLHGANAQGVGTLMSGITAGFNQGYLKLATANLAVTLRQSRAMRDRLLSVGLAYPDQYGEVCNLLECRSWLRPFFLRGRGIGRGGLFKTLTTLIASMFVNRKQLDDPELKYV